LTVFLQLLGEGRFELTDLSGLDGVVGGVDTPGGVGLEVFDLVLDRGVEHLSLGDDRLQLARRGRVRRGEGSLVERRDLSDVGGQCANIGLDGFDARKEVLLGQRRVSGGGGSVLSRRRSRGWNGRVWV
jgi:hypothetical protein